MKRLLSLILAITMIAAFIPAVSAVATADATENLKFVYNFCDGSIDASTDAKARTSALAVTYDKTNGFWAYNNHSNCTNNSYARGLHNGIRLHQHYLATSLTFYRVKINVPVGGTYQLSLDYQTQSGGWADVYFYKLDDPSGMVADNMIKTNSEDSHTIVTSSTAVTGASLGTKTLDAGEWLVTFAVPFDETLGGTYKNNWFHPCKLTLTSSDGKVAPFIRDYTAPSAIEAGESTAMAITASTLLSDAETEAGDITIEYSSSNDKIAKVDASGNITGVADGTATITAKVSAANSDNYVTKTAEVKVGTGVYLDPNEVTIKYDFVKAPESATYKSGTMQYVKLEWYTAANTNNFYWRGWETVKTAAYGPFDGMYGFRICRNDGVDDWITLYINVPKSGYYDVYLDWQTTGKCNFDVFLFDEEQRGDLSFSDACNEMSSELRIASCAPSAAKARSSDKINSEKVYLDAGVNYLMFRAVTSDSGWLVPYSISLVAGSGNALMGGAISGVADALEIDETATASAVAYLSKDASVAGNFTFTSSDPSVLEVSATGAVKALSAGKAEIIATSADAVEGNNEIRKAVTVNAPPAPEAPKAPKVTLLVAGSASGADVDVTVDGASASANAVLSENRGANVTVVANELTGYTFRGWVRGSRDSGVWVSSDAEYSFVAMTNTMLTAIYEENIDGNAVEYYNENGEYIATKAVTEDAPSAPALAGYSFLRWLVGEDKALDLAAIKAPLTRAVAEHTAKASAGLVKVDNVAQEETAFNAPIALSATKEGFTAWKRDGKVVSYSKDYTYYIWSSTDIEESTEAVGEKLPIVVLDADKVDGSWMVEYDSAGYQIAEVGIIFGDDENITIESCQTKRNSQRNSAHGQFAASSECDAAVGYIIYKDNGEYKVIYSK